ncbi:tetratricopeptide repeat protein [Streptomyces sp. PA5.6]|uniref:tetratricopeptide repeat protein n=1 Tax=Streptomyces sp. PA5.6 TaxID=3035651 RepID=UPI0039047D21
MISDLGKGSGARPNLAARASEHGQVVQVGGNYYEAAKTLERQALTTLPAPPAHLVGRAEKSEKLLGLLDPAAQGVPTVAVVAGLAGSGKTALVLQTAHEAVARGWFPGGALFVTLHGYDPARRVEADKAVGLLLDGLDITGEDLPPTLDGQRALYQSELAARAGRGEPVLVVADDAADTGQVLPLLPGPHPHRLLITSRHGLDPVALAARRLPLDELAPAPAAALITDALTRADPDDPRPARDPAALAEIAGHCGRLPLALVIAAALLTADPGLPLPSLAGQLKDEHTRLAALHYADQDNHTLAVRAAFDLSYQRLPPDQARLLRRLASNPGPDVSTETATVLNDDTPARPLLAALTLASLLTEQPVGSDRWRPHDLIRLYAHHQHQHVDDAQTRQDCLARLLEHYRTTADAADDHLRALPGQEVPARFTSRADALAWLDAERSNLLAAATAHPAFASHAATTLMVYLHWRRYFTDALALAQHALTAAHQSDDRHGEADALTNLGLTLREVWRFDEAIDAHTRAAAIFRELDDRHGEGMALNNLGAALLGARRFEEAIVAHTQDLTICRELDDRHREGMALNNLGAALREVRRFDEAIDAHTRAAAIFRELDDRHGEGMALNNLGAALWGARRFDDAVKAHTQDLTICRELDDRHREGMALNNLGAALREVRRFDEAIDAHQQAAAICRELDDRHREGMALGNLGLALREVRRFDEAIDAHQQAAAIFRELDDRHREGMALGNLGLALREVRRFRWIRRAWQAIARTFQVSPR